jgi:hypothetical protein
MQIGYILMEIWLNLIVRRKKRSKIDLDGKYWIQNILIKNHLKSLNKIN